MHFFYFYGDFEWRTHWIYTRWKAFTQVNRSRHPVFHEGAGGRRRFNLAVINWNDTWFWGSSFISLLNSEPRHPQSDWSRKKSNGLFIRIQSTSQVGKHLDSDSTDVTHSHWCISVAPYRTQVIPLVRGCTCTKLGIFNNWFTKK